MMTSEERARKFWHDWYNGDAPGDLKMGDAMVGDDDVAELIALIDAVREEEREATGEERDAALGTPLCERCFHPVHDGLCAYGNAGLYCPCGSE